MYMIMVVRGVVGYNDGFVQAFNPRTGDMLVSNHSHSGSAVKLTKFSLDYYVFNVGNESWTIKLYYINTIIYKCK